MSAAAWIAALLALAVVLGTSRVLYFSSRATPATRPRTWRVAALLLLQLASAALLYRTLLPPSVPTGIDTLVVATAQADSTVANRLKPHEQLIALPEAPAIPTAERVPDLGAALRRHPAIGHLRIVGAGLPARDRDAVAGRSITFEPAPLPTGLVELIVPQRVAAGADVEIHGRVHRLPGGRVELLDPAGTRVDRRPLRADGRFTLTGAARASGPAEFTLRVHDASGRTAESAAVPFEVVASDSLRVLVLAGSPDPELKFLRRWAVDSGIRLHAQVQLGGGMLAGDAPLALDAATLRGFDAVIVDERAWSALGSRRRALIDAAREGLGVLLRVTGPVTAQARRDLGEAGWTLEPASIPTTFALASLEHDNGDSLIARIGPGSQDSPTARITPLAQLPALSRQPLRFVATDLHVALRDDEGLPLVAWRATGRGRTGVWLPIDTYALVLAGRKDLHAQLWSMAIGAIARPRAAQVPIVPDGARQGERLALCGLGEEARVIFPDGEATTLAIDPATGAGRCAGFWPDEAGWHVLRDGAAETPFFVHRSDSTRGIAARRLHEATAQPALASATASRSPASAPGPRWPWFLGWLMLSAMLWWLERSRFGLRTAPAVAG